MVGSDLLAFVEKRYEHFAPEDLDALEEFLDKEKYLSDTARDKLFHHFEDRFIPAEPIELELAEEFEDEDWEATGKVEGKIASRDTWKYKHELYERNNIQWVMLRDRKTGQFVKARD